MPEKSDSQTVVNAGNNGAVTQVRFYSFNVPMPILQSMK